MNIERRWQRTLAAALGVFLVVLAAACSGSTPEPDARAEVEPEAAPVPVVPSLPAVQPPPGQEGLLPVEAPDLSRVRSSARRQIEEEHALLASRTGGAAGPMMLGDAYGQMGMVYLAADFPDSAEPCFRNSQTLQPDEFRWPYYLGHLYRGLGRADDAIAAFRRAIELRPEVPAALIWLGRTHQEQGSHDEAEPLFERAVELNPEGSSGLLGLGQVALSRQDYAVAVKSLEAALEYAPEADVIHYQLALAYRGLGDLEAAEEHLRERGEVDIYPYDPWMDELREALVNPMVHMDRGGRAFANGMFEEAAEEFRLAVQTASDDPQMRFNLGVTLARLDDIPGAVAELQEALKLDAGMADAHYALGAVAENAGRDEDARRFYRAALDADPEHGPAHMRLGQVERRQGRFDEAIEQYREAIRVNPRDAEARLGQLMSLVALERWAEARSRMEEAVSALPEQPAFAHALARILVASPDDTVRDGPRGIQILQQLSSAGPPTTDLGETIAMALAETAQFDQAVSIQQAATRAVEQAGQTELVRAMNVNLGAYRAGTACRTPWRDGDPLFDVPRNAEPPPPQRRPDLG